MTFFFPLISWERTAIPKTLLYDLTTWWIYSRLIVPEATLLSMMSFVLMFCKATSILKIFAGNTHQFVMTNNVFQILYHFLKSHQDKGWILHHSCTSVTDHESVQSLHCNMLPVAISISPPFSPTVPTPTTTFFYTHHGHRIDKATSICNSSIDSSCRHSHQDPANKLQGKCSKKTLSWSSWTHHPSAAKTNEITFNHRIVIGNIKLEEALAEELFFWCTIPFNNRP